MNHLFRIQRFADQPSNEDLAGPTLEPINWVYPHLIAHDDDDLNVVGPKLPYAPGKTLSYAPELIGDLPAGDAILNAENGTHGWMTHPEPQHADKVAPALRYAAQHHTRQMTEWINAGSNANIIGNYAAPYHLPQPNPIEDVQAWYAFGALPLIVCKASGSGIRGISQIAAIADRYQTMRELIVHHAPPTLAIFMDPYDRGSKDAFSSWGWRCEALKAVTEHIDAIAGLWADGKNETPFHVIRSEWATFRELFGGA
jgi:hypothetical protein